MAAYHAERRARCIEQDPIERSAVPPRAGRGGIAGQDRGLETAPREIPAHARQAPGVDVEGGEPGKSGLAQLTVAVPDGLSDGINGATETSALALHADGKVLTRAPTAQVYLVVQYHLGR